VPDTIVAPPIPKSDPPKAAAQKDEPPPSIHVEPDVMEAAASEAAAVDEEPEMHIEDATPAIDEEPPVDPETLRRTSEGDPLPPSMMHDEDAQPAEDVAEALPDEAEPAQPVEEAAPFAASLFSERTGSSFVLGLMENRIGGAGAHVELGEDSYVAPHAATIAFAEDHLLVKDEGGVNGVYVKVNESTPIEPGDWFIAGERVLRYEGPTDLARDAGGDTPFLGTPRPQGTVVRVSEVLSGGKTGRTCHRVGPVIAIGRTACDMNFPADPLLAARHAEIRLGEDGSATLVDLGASAAGVLVRVRAHRDLHAGDVLQIGEQQLKVEFG
jgi:hypothetical protein